MMNRYMFFPQGSRKHVIDHQFTYVDHVEEQVWKTMCGLIAGTRGFSKNSQEHKPLCKRCQLWITMKELSE